MRTILEFNLPDDKEDLKLAQNGASYSMVLYHLDQDLLRANIKYGLKEELRDRIKQNLLQYEESRVLPADESITDIATATLELVRNELYDLVNEYGIELI